MPARDAARAFDSVTQDAITHGVPIPPMALPDDQRRAYLGGEFSGRMKHQPPNPYTDPECARAWLLGLVRIRKELGRGI